MAGFLLINTYKNRDLFEYIEQIVFLLQKLIMSVFLNSFYEEENCVLTQFFSIIDSNNYF